MLAKQITYPMDNPEEISKGLKDIAQACDDGFNVVGFTAIADPKSLRVVLIVLLIKRQRGEADATSDGVWPQI